MKNYKLMTIGVLSMLFSCSTDNNTEDDPCPKGQIQVEIGQPIKFINTTGEWASEIDYQNLSLIATDSQWNYQYAPNGDLIADFPNNIEVKKQFNENNEIEGLKLVLGYVYENPKEKTAIGYFLLKINNKTFDKIIGYYDTRCENLILTKINYNGVEYTTNVFEPIEILKEE
ncbi:MAG TPA: hypothetical protein VLY87_01000 [Flavobacterium sp.]|nr:hypothetical protein [Flavobacterium sp.]